MQVLKNTTGQNPTRRPGRAGTLYLVHVLTHASRTRLDAGLLELGISAFQYTLLSVVARHDGLSSSALSRRFHVTPQAMGDTIMLLEQRGLIERRQDEANRRLLRLSLTEAGMTIVAGAGRVVEAFERRIFAGVPAAELATMRGVLEAALEALREGS